MFSDSRQEKYLIDEHKLNTDNSYFQQNFYKQYNIHKQQHMLK